MTPITQETTIHVQRGEEELEIVVTGYIDPLVRGKFHGPPENCYPDEGGFAELDESTHKGQPFELTDKEKEEAEEALYQAWEDDEPDYDEPEFYDD